VPAGWHRLPWVDFGLVLAGAVITTAGAVVAAGSGAKIGVGAVAAVALFVLVVLAFLRVPHYTIVGAIFLFACSPSIKVFVSSSLGGLKDLVSVAAITAAVILIVFYRRRVDRPIAVLAALFMILYVVNVGHGHDTAWAQGVRLSGEPVGLLIAGLVLPNPRRNLRFALGALVCIGVLESLYGLLQQLAGAARLVSWGYSYSQQVRTISGFLRSFGTLDDSFGFAALLYFSLGAVVFWMRSGVLAWIAGAVILAGLASSFVRTAAPILIAFMALGLVRRGQALPAIAFALATLAIATATLLTAGGSESRTYTVYFANGGTTEVHATVAGKGALTFNGRTSSWHAAVGSDPFNWAFGRGVGKVGTAALRATQGLLGGSSSSGSSSSAASHLYAVDSGYFATMADVGLVGLLVLLALFWRLLSLTRRAARQGLTNGWVGIGITTALLIDALTRGSFNAFPTGFIGMLVIGLAVAACQSEMTRDDPPSGRALIRPAGRLGGRRLSLNVPGR
jgi:hypothetical protein